MLEGDLAGHQGGDVAVGALDEAAAAGGQVEHHLGSVELHAVEVDEVEVGALAGGDDAAVGEAVGGRGPGGLEADRLLEADCVRRGTGC